ncbi:MAG: AAA family ATPase [Acidobacteria bacterium]|nr:AAA family ATPase [Acidobacteriota bacterium]
MAECKFTAIRAASEPFPSQDAASDKVLAHIAEKAPRGTVFILKDFHLCWSRNPVIVRKLRNMVRQLREKGQFLVITTPVNELPVELKDDVAVVEVPLPDADTLENVFTGVTRSLDSSSRPTPAVREKLIGSALGLTTNQARLAFARAYARKRQFDESSIDAVMGVKRQLIRESGALEFWPATAGESGVGGLDKLKDWLRLREKAFGQQARQAHLPYPRGIALIGIPGTGKSLSAKMLAGQWKLPLLRLDVGTLFGSLLGESERNMRRAIQLAETVSPCILWIDEVEKAFAGSGLESAGGAATRVFGYFLTWMQERQGPVFVLATANDVSALPPEFMARFDRTFFLDLPNRLERRQIFAIHLKNAGVAFPERTLRFEELVERSNGYVGREIERMVREAQFMAFADDNREIEMEDLLKALEETIPISRSHAEVIEQLRKWKTEGRAFPASSEETAAPVAGRRILET